MIFSSKEVVDLNRDSFYSSYTQKPARSFTFISSKLHSCLNADYFYISALENNSSLAPRLLPWLFLLAFNTLIVVQEVRLELAAGNDNLESNIRAHLDLTEKNCQQSRAELTATLPTVEESVIRAGQALGYYFLEQQISVEFIEDCWTVKINATPGEAITIGEVNLELNSNEQLFSNLLNNLPITAGD